MLTYLNRKFKRRQRGLFHTAHVITCCAAVLCILNFAAPQVLAQSPYRDGGYPERLDRDRTPAAEEETPVETEGTRAPFYVPGVSDGPRIIPMRPTKKPTRSGSRSQSEQTQSSTRERPAEQQRSEEQQRRAEQQKRAEQKAREERQKRAEQKEREERQKRAELEKRQKQAEQRKREEQAKRSAASTQKLVDEELNTWIGQMLMVGFKGQGPNEAGVKKLIEQIKSGAVGGVVFLSHNIVSPKQVKELTDAFRRKDGETPVFIAVDQEGGIVQRLAHEKGFSSYPTAAAIGKRNDPLTAYAVYKGLANELKKYGFNLNMGPVVDLQHNGTNSIIAIKERAFGSKPMHVTAFAKAFCAAHKDAGILTVLKHFPGHGSTPADTHTASADISKTWSEDELVPYQKLIQSGDAEIIMVGHVMHANMADEPGMPASLSKKAITGKLRGELKFSGVVISDDLEMDAVSKNHPLEDSVIRAINAGVDIVLLGNQIKPSPDLPEHVAAIIRQAVADGKLKREQLKASYQRIIAVKSEIKTQGATAIISANHDAGGNNGTTPAGR